MLEEKMLLIHPGEILFEEFLEPMGISIDCLAKDLGVPLKLIAEIIHGKREITADIALRLGRYFSISPQFWLNLQDHYNLEVETDNLGDRLIDEVKVFEPVGST